MGIFLRKKKYARLARPFDLTPKERDEAFYNPKYEIEHTGVTLKDIPFTGARNEVIYMEDDYDEDANRCIRENYDLIKECFAKKNLRFVYLPWLGKELNDERILKYQIPNGDVHCDIDITPLKSNYLLDFMLRPENRYKVGKPCFARFYTPWFDEYSATSQPSETIFDLYIFNVNTANSDLKGYFECLVDQALIYKQWGGVFSIDYNWPKNADEGFDEETKYILKDVEYKIDLLRRKGISEVVLQKLVMPKPKLSKLVITKDLRIFLPDYDNMEITMEPLVKAVFLLFLKHPEGIMFKELPEYRRELAEIYGRIKGARVSRNLFGIRSYDKSIINATDPLNNSINEKCARIRAAFLLKFQESLAENYFITGKRGEPKMIKLPRNMVEWEE